MEKKLRRTITKAASTSEGFFKIFKAIRQSPRIRFQKDITSIYLLRSSNIDNHNPANSNKFGNNIEQKYYLGTVIEFVLIESINDEDEEPYSQAKDKQRALKEIIMNADEIATINPQNRKRRRRSSRKYTASDNLGGSKASRRSNITKADTGQSSDIIKTKRDIAEILHNISVARSSGVSQHNKSGGDKKKNYLNQQKTIVKLSRKTVT
ncbi:uncharacterized protein ASCRUDRAFT_71430 [Ascoidea rubescens DSM 1968]|uniref:Uncharacterized protein n=1 Tax=Ascoidea rubescens DSM 1968 TaxID=1344418 RepID=A0A1D2VE27_9ASCO|nr:hypothetical protein ASCRUDRAFT_71430 [Ascoidea rubescens DSM 1968]ODV59958.1 hypothetical protein ASCRUDRAFT_71430 [Ascoidea rubescens DSM 1968]